MPIEEETQLHRHSKLNNSDDDSLLAVCSGVPVKDIITESGQMCLIRNGGIKKKVCVSDFVTLRLTSQMDCQDFPVRDRR